MLESRAVAGRLLKIRAREPRLEAVDVLRGARPRQSTVPLAEPPPSPIRSSLSPSRRPRRRAPSRRPSRATAATSRPAAMRRVSAAAAAWRQQGLRRAITSWVSAARAATAALVRLRRSVEMLQGGHLQRGFQALWSRCGEVLDTRLQPLRHWSRRQLSAAWVSWRAGAAQLSAVSLCVGPGAYLWAGFRAQGSGYASANARIR